MSRGELFTCSNQLELQSSKWNDTIWHNTLGSPISCDGVLSDSDYSECDEEQESSSLNHYQSSNSFRYPKNHNRFSLIENAKTPLRSGIAFSLDRIDDFDNVITVVSSDTVQFNKKTKHHSRSKEIN